LKRKGLRPERRPRSSGAFPLWQFCRRLGRWEVVSGLAAVLHSVPGTVADRWTLASWLPQPNRVPEQWAPLELLIENGGVDEAWPLTTKRVPDCHLLPIPAGHDIDGDHQQFSSKSVLS